LSQRHRQPAAVARGPAQPVRRRAGPAGGARRRAGEPRGTLQGAGRRLERALRDRRDFMSVERDRMLRAIATVLTDQPRLPMEQLAQALGISRATLHRAFPNREAIVEAVLALALETSRRAIDDAAI